MHAAELANALNRWADQAAKDYAEAVDALSMLDEVDDPTRLLYLIESSAFTRVLDAASVAALAERWNDLRTSGRTPERALQYFIDQLDREVHFARAGTNDDLQRLVRRRQEVVADEVLHDLHGIGPEGPVRQHLTEGDSALGDVLPGT